MKHDVFSLRLVHALCFVLQTSLPACPVSWAMLGRAHRTPASVWMEGPLRGMPPRPVEQVSFATAQQGVICFAGFVGPIQDLHAAMVHVMAAGYCMTMLPTTESASSQDAAIVLHEPVACSGHLHSYMGSVVVLCLKPRSLETSVGVGVLQSLADPSGGACCPAGGINAERAGSEDSLASLPKLQPVHRLAKPDLKIVQRIGEGAFGEVSVAKAPLYGTVAVKWLKVRVQLLQQVVFVLHLHSGPILSSLPTACVPLGIR